MLIFPTGIGSELKLYSKILVGASVLKVAFRKDVDQHIAQTNRFIKLN